MGVEPIKITKENFSAQVPTEGIAILDFWAPWCMPCNQFAPVFEAAASRHSDVVFGKVNTDEQQELAAAFKIRSIPSVIVFRDGIVMYEKAGILNGRTLDTLLESIRTTNMDAVKADINAALAKDA